MAAIFNYGMDHLTVEKAMSIVRGETKAVLNAATLQKVKASQQHVQEIVNNNSTVYGINTGFGILSNTRISASDTQILQHKILQSHSVGVGASIPTKVAKLMLITKVHALAQGYSGVQIATLERIIWHINNNIIPVVPEKGSVGASGDLAPLAHLFLPLIGLGTVHTPVSQQTINNEGLPAATVLAQHHLTALQLGPKEGLALINGTQFILAFSIVAVERMHNCLEAADIVGAMSLEALTGTKSPFDERLHQLRPFTGNQLVAQRLRLLLEGSAIMQSHIDCAGCRIPIPFDVCRRYMGRVAQHGYT